MTNSYADLKYSPVDYYTTIYKGVPNDGSRAEIGRSHLIMMSNIDVAAYNNLVSILSDFFCKAQLSAQDDVSWGPLHLSVVVPAICLKKWKDDDGDTLIYRLWWIIDNLRDPINGVVVSIYINSNISGKDERPWAQNHLWQTKKTWKPNWDKTISIQAHGEVQHQPSHSARLYLNESVEIIESMARSLNYDIKYVDYSTPIDDLYEIMLNTKHHFSYTGSTGYFAALTRTPTLYIGRHTRDGRVGWNLWAGHACKTLQPIPNTNHMITQEPSYYKAINAMDPKYLNNLEQAVSLIL